MHNSLFSYNVSRPYPYRWFTWVVFLGGIVATTIFSLIVVAAEGLQLVTIFTMNITEVESPSKRPWYQHRPWSFASKAGPNCTAQILNLGQSETYLYSRYEPTKVAYHTSNHLFPYTIMGIDDPSRYVEIYDHANTDPRLAYKDDKLHDCVLTGLSIGSAQYTSIAISRTVDVTIHLDCAVSHEDRGFVLHLMSEFLIAVNTGTPVITSGSSFEGSYSCDFGSETQASALWGCSLFPQSKIYSNDSATWNVAEARIDFTLVSNLYELYMNYQLLTIWVNTTISNTINHSYFEWADLRTKMGDFRTMTNTSDPWTELVLLMNEFGKVLSWMVLTDLGQVNNNMLADPEGLMSYQTQNVAYLETVQDSFLTTIAYSFNQTQLHNDANSNDTTAFYQRAGTGVPHVEPASFAQIYTCQIPAIKPAVSLIIVIAVADLVFLQTLWEILSWTMLKIMERQHPRAHYCAGCEETILRNEREIAMTEGVNNTDIGGEPDDADLHGRESSKTIKSYDDGSDTESGQPTVTRLTIIDHVAKNMG